jgi:hypothetical protein
LWATQGELAEEQAPWFFSSTQNPTRYHLNFFSYSVAAPFSISKFGQLFSNPFGGIIPWYVTPPLIQFIFDILLYILRRMLLLVSHIILEKFMYLQILG